MLAAHNGEEILYHCGAGPQERHRLQRKTALASAKVTTVAINDTV